MNPESHHTRETTCICSDLAIVDSMEVAYRAFQECRHAFPRAEMYCELLTRIMTEVRKQQRLFITFPANQVRQMQEEQPGVLASQADPLELQHLRQPADQLLGMIECAAKDLARLSRYEQFASLRSLGYAVHFIPHLIRDGEIFDQAQFRFALHIATRQWGEFSMETKDRISVLAGFTTEQVYEHLERAENRE